MSREAAEGQGGPRALAWTRLTYLLATPQQTQAAHAEVAWFWGCSLMEVGIKSERGG